MPHTGRVASRVERFKSCVPLDGLGVDGGGAGERRILKKGEIPSLRVREVEVQNRQLRAGRHTAFAMSASSSLLPMMNPQPPMNVSTGLGIGVVQQRNIAKHGQRMTGRARRAAERARAKHTALVRLRRRTALSQAVTS